MTKTQVKLASLGIALCGGILMARLAHYAQLHLRPPVEIVAILAGYIVWVGALAYINRPTTSSRSEFAWRRPLIFLAIMGGIAMYLAARGVIGPANLSFPIVSILIIAGYSAALLIDSR